MASSDLLERLLGTAFSSAIGAYDRFDPSVVTYFLNMPEVADRARKLTERADPTGATAGGSQGVHSMCTTASRKERTQTLLSTCP